MVTVCKRKSQSNYFSSASSSERKHGKHPSQKSTELIQRIINIATNPGEIILDCFSGSGTTAIAANNLGRHWVMVEKNSDYNDIFKRRLADYASDSPSGFEINE